jgi:hypothetical protein
MNALEENPGITPTPEPEYCTWCKRANPATQIITRNGDRFPFCDWHTEEFKKAGDYIAPVIPRTPVQVTPGN